MRRVAVLTLLTLASSAWAVDGPALSFNEALGLIVKRSTPVGIQTANLESTRARNIPIRLAFAPSLAAVGVQQDSKYDLYSTARARSGMINGSLNLFRFGADVANWQAATADENAQVSLLDATTLRSEDAAVQVLVAEIQQQLTVGILTRIATTQSEVAEIGHERYKRGYLALQESGKLDVDLANAEARQHDAEIQHAAATANLVSALGHANIVANWPWKQRFANGETVTLLAAKPTLEKLPSWRAAHEQLQAEEDRTTRNLRQILPTLDGSAGYGYTNFQNPGGPYATGWTATFTLTVPFFDRLTNYSTYKAQVYTRQIAELNLEQAERDARSEWTAAHSAFELAFRSALSRDKTLGISRKLYEDNLRRFQSGRISANDLVVDQTRLYDSELLAVQGWAAAHLAYARLRHSLGLSVL